MLWQMSQDRLMLRVNAFYTLRRRYRDVCCHPLLCSQLGKESVYQTLFICCQHPPPSIRPLLTDTDWVLLVKLYARQHSSRQTTTPLCPLTAASLPPSLALTPVLGWRWFFFFFGPRMFRLDGSEEEREKTKKEQKQYWRGEEERNCFPKVYQYAYVWACLFVLLWAQLCSRYRVDACHSSALVPPL